MDKRSKALIATLFVLAIVSIGLSYYRTMVKRDFSITESEPPASTTDDGSASSTPAADATSTSTSTPASMATTTGQ